MRPWRDSGWRSCPKMSCSRTWHKAVSSECLRIGARRFRATICTVPVVVSPRQPFPCLPKRSATGLPRGYDARCDGSLLNDGARERDYYDQVGDSDGDCGGSEGTKAIFESITC